MTVFLHSTDPHVVELCRQTLKSMAWSEVKFITRDSAHTPVRADLAIWDIDGSPVPLSVENFPNQENLLIASRGQTTLLRDRLPKNTASILLKPLQEGPLRVYLEQAMNRKKCVPDEADSNAKNLLQFTLEAIVRLQEYDQDRTNFIARAVHDFRAPLTALKGYCGLLLDERLGGALGSAEAEVLIRMRRSVERLSKMADDMFQVAVGTRCEPKQDFQEIEVLECLEQAVHELRPLVDRKQLCLMLDAQAPSRPAQGHAAQIEQVFLNILDNACKFTPRGGLIEIKAYPFFWDRRWANAVGTNELERRRENVPVLNSFRIDICDSGPSIPPDQLPKIFEEYTCFNGGQDRSGAGLGLAICKMIVSRHNGRIWAESNTDGNVFSVVLPFSQAMSRAGSPVQ